MNGRTRVITYSAERGGEIETESVISQNDGGEPITYGRRRRRRTIYFSGAIDISDRTWAAPDRDQISQTNNAILSLLNVNGAYFANGDRKGGCAKKAKAVGKGNNR